MRGPDPPTLSGVREVFLDLETTGLRWWAGDRPIGVALAWDDHPAVYLPFRHSEGNLDEETVRRWAREQLRGKRIVGLNTKFDLHCMREWGVDLEALGSTATDVAHSAALLDDNRRSGFSLEALGQEFLGEGKVKGLDVRALASLPASEVAPYAIQDVELTRKLHRLLAPRIDEEGLTQVLALEDACVWPTMEMEKNGAPLDAERLDRWLHESEQAILRAGYLVEKEVGFPVRPKSRLDLVKLFAARGLKNTYLTESGKFPSFTDDVLELFTHDEVVAQIRKTRRIESVRGMYLTKYHRASDGGRDVLRYALHQLRADEYGTIGGRYSSSAPTKDPYSGANVQQVATVEGQRTSWGYAEDDSTHDDEIYLIRKLFIPKSGTYLSADAKQIEYRLFAHYTRSQQLLDAYRGDPNVNFHKVVWGMVQQRLPSSTYRMAKAANFSLVCGAGPKTVSKLLGVPVEEANGFISAYDHEFPEAKKLLHHASKVAKTRGYVKSLTGRRFRFPDGEFTYKAVNRVIQGGAADVMKRKLVELHAERRRTGFLMRMTVHDEVCGDVPDAESARMVDEILNRQSFELMVPILWDTKTGSSWAACA